MTPPAPAGAERAPAATAGSRTDPFQVRVVAADDPVLQPLLTDLEQDYTGRYPDFDIAREMTGYAADEFNPPGGAFLVLVDEHGEVVAGGAYRRRESDTAELKRVWTSSAHRRRGLARRMVTALEEHLRAAGYTRVFLTTGPRQPEARALYLALGYRPVGDHDAVVATASAPLPFVKDLDVQDLAPRTATP